MPAGTTLSNLVNKLLESLDVYNSNDTDIDTIGTSGSQAKLAINQALQKIYSIAKNTPIVQQETSSTSLASTSGQDYIALSAISDLDDIVSIFDASNNYNLKRISFKEYRRLYPDPSETSGPPVHYARYGDYIFVGPRPDAAYTYTTFYTKLISDLTTVGATTSLSSKFDYWILAEARVFWQLMEDASDTAKLSSYKAIADECRTTAMDDLEAEYDLCEEAESHWDQQAPITRPQFDTPAGQ